MRPLFLVIFLLCFVLLGASAAILFYTQYVIYDTQYIPMDVRVSDHIGFNLETDMLHFGRTTSPGNAERGITITNKHTQPLRVTIQTYGDIGGWVYTNEYDHIFEPNTSREVMFGINVPSGIPHGDYNGTIRVLFMRNLI